MVRVGYIGGLGRSGTTLLERMLGELADFAPAGEVVHLWERGVLRGERCGCGEPFHDCPFWDKVGITAFGGWHNVDVARLVALRQRTDRSRYIPRLATARLPADQRALLEEYLTVYQRLYDAIAQVSGRPIVLDSSKHASLAYCLRQASGIDLRVVHVVRDSRAVAHSWTRAVRRPEALGPDKYMKTYSPGRAALLWDAHNVSFGLLGRLGVPVFRLRYEDLLRNPVAVLCAIARFAGSAVDPADLSFVRDGVVRLPTTHTVSGNPMRFQHGEVPLRLDDAWRSQLPPAQRRLVSALTLPLLLRYGYPAGRRR